MEWPSQFQWTIININSRVGQVQVLRIEGSRLCGKSQSASIIYNGNEAAIYFLKQVELKVNFFSDLEQSTCNIGTWTQKVHRRGLASHYHQPDLRSTVHCAMHNQTQFENLFEGRFWSIRKLAPTNISRYMVSQTTKLNYDIQPGTLMIPTHHWSYCVIWKNSFDSYFIC